MAKNKQQTVVEPTTLKNNADGTLARSIDYDSLPEASKLALAQVGFARIMDTIVAAKTKTTKAGGTVTLTPAELAEKLDRRLAELQAGTFTPGHKEGGSRKTPLQLMIYNEVFGFLIARGVKKADAAEVANKGEDAFIAWALAYMKGKGADYSPAKAQARYNELVAKAEAALAIDVTDTL